MLLILASVYKNYLVMQLKASFNQRLAVLTPNRRRNGSGGHQPETTCWIMKQAATAGKR